MFVRDRGHERARGGGGGAGGGSIGPVASGTVIGVVGQDGKRVGGDGSAFVGSVDRE